MVDSFYLIAMISCLRAKKFTALEISRLANISSHERSTKRPFQHPPQSHNMSSLKRKSGSKPVSLHVTPAQKKQKLAVKGKPTKPKAEPIGADLDESDTTEDDEFDGLSADGGAEIADDEDTSDLEANSAVPAPKRANSNGANGNRAQDEANKKFKRESALTAARVLLADSAEQS